MKLKLFALVMTAGALCASAAVKDPNEKNPFSDYDLGMRPAVGDPMAVEWQDANDAAIAAATTDEALAACVVDEACARALLSKLRGAYASMPLALTRMAAVSQWVMTPEPCWFCFWKPSPAAGRKIWVKALLDKAEQEGDAYIKTFCLDQLRWCAPACPCVICRIEGIAEACDDKNVKEFAALVIREIKR